MLKKTIAACCLLAAPAAADGQMRLVEEGKPQARIVLAEDTEETRAAAGMLNLFIGRVTGAELPVADGRREKPGRRGGIYIGGLTAEAGYDGFLIECSGGSISVKSGGGRGCVYGIATLLERHIGVSCYAKDFYTFEKRRTLDVPAFRTAETPAFRYRQTYSYGNDDPVYHDWFRLREPSDVFAADLWVHTFDRILPSSVYGKSHPEYYSCINGERRPGSHSQWCLSNPDVLEQAAHNIDSIFRANPGMRMMSVSQNDGNNTQCACPECKAVEEYEGSPSGNLIRFLNKLAARFPDKEFSTLAYLYSMRPPLHAKPLPNVNIMLCDIDCRREVPLTDNDSGRDFVKALEGWSRISDNIFVWDYGINFDNLVSPFPNFHVLQKNIQLFRKNHATMLFEQVNGVRGADFSELRAYMLGKLMWNPEADADSLMRSFMDGYYGAAANCMYQYRKLMEGALLAGGTPLWIYDSPISHKDGMLNARLRKSYNELFDRAEELVKSDSARLSHVRMARLPLQYACLEIARAEGAGYRERLAEDALLFKERCSQLGVTSYTERGNSPDEYCEFYLQRFLPGGRENKAQGAKVAWGIAPDEKYKALGDTALTDGLYGGTTYVESWVGWVGSDADFTLDMGESKTFSSIEADFLHQLGAWILLPDSVAYSVSADGKSFTPFGEALHFAEDRDLAVKFKAAKASVERPVTARYIRVRVKGIGMCPSWHYGVGYPAWFFMDEVMVE